MNADMIIDRLGGTVKAAQLCDVSKAAVSQWRRNGIPKARLMFLRIAKPDVFEDCREERGNPQGAGHA